MKRTLLFLLSCMVMVSGASFAVRAGEGNTFTVTRGARLPPEFNAVWCKDRLSMEAVTALFEERGKTAVKKVLDGYAASGDPTCSQMPPPENGTYYEVAWVYFDKAVDSKNIQKPADMIVPIAVRRSDWPVGMVRFSVVAVDSTTQVCPLPRSEEEA